MADIIPVVELATKQFIKQQQEYAAKGKILTEENEIALFARCIHLQTLTSPDSAKVPPLEDSYVSKQPDGTYKVSGYLDSKNSFGTYIRSQYTYTIEKSNGELKCPNVFVNASQQEAEKKINNFNKLFTSHTILWWILGIASAIITITVSTCQMSSLF